MYGNVWEWVQLLSHITENMLFYPTEEWNRTFGGTRLLSHIIEKTARRWKLEVLQ